MRSPLTWETMFPPPRPQRETFAVPRIALAASFPPDPENETESERQFRAVHPMGAELAQECVTMMGESMSTPLFHNKPRDRWVLETGAHMWGLDHLLRTYPDARIVFTHRDPVKSVTSYASLTCHVRAMGSDQVVPAEVVQDWTGRLLQAIIEPTVRDSGEFLHAACHDMHFQDFVADQFAVVSDVYSALGLPMTEQAAPRMQAFIADNPKGKNGLHLYTPEEYGIDPAQVRRDFAPHIEHHAVAPE